MEGEEGMEGGRAAGPHALGGITPHPLTVSITVSIFSPSRSSALLVTSHLATSFIIIITIY
eukprot:3237291-Rhodomonas_salina.2